MLWTLGGMSINLKKNNNALIMFQCYVITTRCNETTCVMIQCMAILKLRPPISCAYVHPLCFCSKNHKKIERKQETNKRTWKKWRKKKKTTKDNLIFPHVNITFLLIGPYAFTHTHCSLQKHVFNLKVQFASNRSLEFWTLDLRLKWP
jgi:hypothetical protein